MSDKRRNKRWKREHRKKTTKDHGKLGATVSTAGPGDVRLVYRPGSPEEANRRADRANNLVGVPFIRLPGNLPTDQVLFTTTDGTPVTVEAVEMVYNDALLMDAVSNWGKDGPLYEQTLDERHMEVYRYAQKAYLSVALPPKLIKPEKPS